MDQPTLSESKQTHASDMESEKLVRETQKLDLEIVNLRKKNNWESFSPLIPLVASAVTVIGLLIGLYQFRSGQRLLQENALRAERQNRTTTFQNQLREDVDQIFAFPREKSLTLSRTAFLIEDLHTILDSNVDEQTKMRQQLDPNYERNISQNLAYLITYDTDFIKNARDVGFAAVALEHWKDYGVYMKTDLIKLNLVLYQYTRALRYLRDSSPRYFEDMTVDQESGEYVVQPKYEKQKDEEERYQRFLDIRDGFVDHLRLIADDTSSEAREISGRNEKEFEGALCNPALSKAIFANRFSGEPCQP
jgi:hypothetical protein